MFRSLAFLLTLSFPLFVIAAEVAPVVAPVSVNIADPKLHPYADPAGGRENYPLSTQKTNQFRLYDFSQRQADYYMAMAPAQRPTIFPAYPGLDANLHGHWGKYNQNNHSDDRWNGMEIGSLLTHLVADGETIILKGTCVKSDGKVGSAACFDQQTLSYRAVWDGGFVHFNGFRWGTSRNASIVGDVWLRDAGPSVAEGTEWKYLGLHRHGQAVVFRYRIGDAEILDHPHWADGWFFRTLHVLRAGKGFALRVAPGAVLAASGQVGLSLQDSQLKADGVADGTTLTLGYRGKAAVAEMPTRLVDVPSLILPGPPAWPQTVTTQGKTAAAPAAQQPYVIDTLEVPLKSSPFKSIMQLTSIAFDAEGRAYITTLAGEVWRVSGINDRLDKLTWKRFASGLNQPFGMHIDKGGLFVIDRSQILRLHDYNGDGEADFYENYANDYGGYNKSHTDTFGLHRTADGCFHFTNRIGIYTTDLQQNSRRVAWGVRNCMGIGGGKDYFWVAPQEGDWTPASAIIEVHPGEFYGLPEDGKGGDKPDPKTGRIIAPPLCYVPRSIDNSTGGMQEITSSKWGPFAGAHVGISFGYGTQYLILRDATGTRPLGAVVPLEGELPAGGVRAAFHPHDGQCYVVGLDGWGDYAVQDGCLQRLRYTGQPVYKPSGFRVHGNGLRIDFPIALDKASVEDAAHYLVQTWNYEYARRYGSPEFSVATPASLGHDPVEVRSARLLEGGKSIFVEMPTLVPAMQMHVRMHLRAADGTDFKTDLFPSPLFLGADHAAEGLAASMEGKPKAIALRELKEVDKTTAESGKKSDHARELLVTVRSGMQYHPTLLTATPGEALKMRLHNTDAMPHNLVLITPESTVKVGEAATAMLTDPQAGVKHYIPALPEVLHFIPVLEPETQHVLHFKAPSQPGDYPFICTFPGHWQAMRGVLRIAP